MLTKEQINVVQAEIDRQHIQRALVRVAVGNTITPDEYRAMITYERYKAQIYERERGLFGRIADGLLVGWATLWLGLCELSEMLTREG